MRTGGLRGAFGLMVMLAAWSGCSSDAEESAAASGTDVSVDGGTLDGGSMDVGADAQDPSDVAPDTAGSDADGNDTSAVPDTSADAGSDTGPDTGPDSLTEPECTTDTDCDDGIACTVDSCNLVTSTCRATPGDNLCCVSADDCEDGDPCTANLCAGNACVFPTAPPEDADCTCVAHIQCDDKNPCTEDKCLLGSCHNAPIAGDGCCTGPTDPQCDGVCYQQLCVALPQSCTTASECPAPSACWTSTCDGGVCGAVPTAGCCEAAVDCDDQSDATTDSCVAGECLNVEGDPAACSVDSDCGDSSGCVERSCHASGVCHTVFTSGDGCCASAADCAQPDDPCSVATCTANVCGMAVNPEPVWFWESSFDDGTLQGWTTESNGTGAQWQVSTAKVSSGTHSLYFGKLPEMSIDVGISNGTATSPTIEPEAGGLVLRFERNILVEPISSKDKFWLEVLANKVTTEVWNKNTDNGPGNGWKTADVDLTSVVNGAPFQLLFRFDSLDAVSNEYEGIYLDTVRVGRLCQ